MKILNLYSGIGGNRELWGNDHDITAVERNKEIADFYKKLYPNDNVLIENAHDYLIDNFTNYDFIWSSPPCKSHSQCRYYSGAKSGKYEPLYFDMKLYQEIILLKYHFKGLFLIENTEPYYQPLISPSMILSRHYLWSNFDIRHREFEKSNIEKNTIGDYREIGDLLKKTKIMNKRQVLRNRVKPIIGKYILDESKRNNYVQEDL